MRTLFLLLVCWFAAGAGAATPGEVPIGSVLRDARLNGLSGKSRLLSDYRGKPLIINVWASWCGPCREEMGSLEKLSRRYGGKQFAVIGISTDDYVDKAKAFVTYSKTTFSHYIDRNLQLENMLGANRLPVTLLIDAQGRVLSKTYGARDWDSPAALDFIGKTFRSRN